MSAPCLGNDYRSNPTGIGNVNGYGDGDGDGDGDGYGDDDGDGYECRQTGITNRREPEGSCEMYLVGLAWQAR